MLLLMGRRFLGPRRTSAWIRFSGIPQRPKPPSMMVAPSGISATAAALVATFFKTALRMRWTNEAAYAMGRAKANLQLQIMLQLRYD